MLGTLRGALYWILGGVMGQAILWAYSGEFKLRSLAMFIAAGLFVNFAAWVFKNVEREPVGEKPSHDGGEK